MINKFYYKKSISSKEINKEFSVLSEQIKKWRVPAGFLQFIFYTLAELFANIKEHSKAKKVLIESKKENKNFLIKVSDNGIGLRNSYITHSILPKDDNSAIEFALSGLSIKNSRERGYGLYSIRQLVEMLKGKMEIKTGKSQAEITKGEIKFRKNLKKEKGVSILIKTKIQNNVDIYKVLK